MNEFHRASAAFGAATSEAELDAAFLCIRWDMAAEYTLRLLIAYLSGRARLSQDDGR